MTVFILTPFSEKLKYFFLPCYLANKTDEINKRTCGIPTCMLGSDALHALFLISLYKGTTLKCAYRIIQLHRLIGYFMYTFFGCCIKIYIFRLQFLHYYSRYL